VLKKYRAQHNYYIWEIDIMDYVILSNANKDSLEDTVEVAIGKGWELVGGVAIVWDGREKTYYQAVTKKP